ncbi:helix-turn-helix domain-containing protein [Suttonella ornithocola]|uniref:Putative Fis-like DNA-binding protein n=1 Tax=Suttonella ornithocola TaxID=279832 RepID=A0A380MYA0_9GAMM|nr:helix-turn-helix domain-containing protein [Suttonella ornithocola]SUO97539.1 Hin recombinational enhancer-binding protein [Suttonella ornithocola]
MANLSIQTAVTESINNYLKLLDGEAEPTDIYRLIVGEVETVLVDYALSLHNGNQSKAAKWLGITRNTLRKKMQESSLNVQSRTS